MTTTPDQIARALKPCPHCGDKAQLRHHSGPECWVECSQCGAVGPNDGETTTDQNIDAWNTRATLSQPTDPNDGLTPADAWQELVNYDDRTSPEEYPDMALITRDELASFMERAAIDPNDGREAQPVAWMYTHPTFPVEFSAHQHPSRGLNWSETPLYAPTPPEAQPVAVREALEAIETLANIEMNCSLEQWSLLSGKIISALAATPAPIEPTEAEAREVLDRLTNPLPPYSASREVLYPESVVLRAMLAFATTRPAAAVERDKLIEVIRKQLASFDYPVSQYEQDFADAILAAIHHGEKS